MYIALNNRHQTAQLTHGHPPTSLASTTASLAAAGATASLYSTCSGFCNLRLCTLGDCAWPQNQRVGNCQLANRKLHDAITGSPLLLLSGSAGTLPLMRNAVIGARTNRDESAPRKLAESVCAQLNCKIVGLSHGPVDERNRSTNPRRNDQRRLHSRDRCHDPFRGRGAGRARQIDQSCRREVKVLRNEVGEAAVRSIARAQINRPAGQGGLEV